MIDIGLGVMKLDLGTILLLICLVALLFDAFFVILGDYIEKWEIYSEISLLVGILAGTTSFLCFSYYILSADYRFTYVIDHVNNEMNFFLRLSAIWSGQAGSYFFWMFLASVTYLAFRFIFRDYAHETIFWRSFVLSAFQVTVLAALTLLSDPFKIDVRPISDGIGLNPLLMNMWNIIHPPIIFIGYVLCLVPMTIAIARISILKDGKIPRFEGKEKLDRFFDFMVSLAWLVLSSGIIIGAYWAYITLGWGGFWAWDPVETASLIPWLFLTLYFHGKPFLGKSAYLANYIVSMTYTSTLFATYLTRSNIISSVHTFKPENTLEIFLRFFIPENSFLMSIILRFIPNERMLILFIVISVTFLIPHFIGKNEVTRIPSFLRRSDFQVSKSKITALKISFIFGLFGTYIIILGLVSPVIYDVIGYIVAASPEGLGMSITVDPLFYNTVATIFGGFLLLVQFFCTFFPKFSFRKKTISMIGGVLTSILFSLSGFLYRNGILDTILDRNNLIVGIFSNIWTTSDKANFIVPLLIIGIISLVIEFFRVIVKENKNVTRKSSQIMLHLSFLVVLLGALLSANMTMTNEIIVENQGEYVIPGTRLTISILDMDTIIPQSGLHAIEYDTTFLLTAGSQVIGGGVTRLAYDKVNRMDHKVTIVSTLLYDVYIVTGTAITNPVTGNLEAAVLQVKVIPYINILWFGCLLLHFAIIPLVIRRFIQLTEAVSGKKSETDFRKIPTRSVKPEEEIAVKGGGIND